MSSTVPLSDSSRVGEARRTAALMATGAGLSASESNNLGIVITEAANNAIRHAKEGQLILRPLSQNGSSGVEMLCLDRGPGMANVAECLRDGFSTGGSMGTGLGAASRLANTFDIFSAVDTGTVVLARVWAGGTRKGSAAPLVASICVPLHGEQRCGDGWAASAAGTRTVLLAVDGLGHGVYAAEAADTAVRIFLANASRGPSEMLDLLHRGLRGTRGAAAAIAEIDAGRRKVSYAGVGNISGNIVTDQTIKTMVSHSGIVGHHLTRINQFEYDLPPDGVVVMHSDGLTNKWRVDRYPGLFRRDPALLAGVLYRDFTRGRDDASVIIFRPQQASP
jgi:anti-sigma regulatory factor (Ser/Thr protein kinase)